METVKQQQKAVPAGGAGRRQHRSVTGERFDEDSKAIFADEGRKLRTYQPSTKSAKIDLFGEHPSTIMEDIIIHFNEMGHKVEVHPTKYRVNIAVQEDGRTGL